jgi:hypothetical protein
MMFLNLNPSSILCAFARHTFARTAKSRIGAPQGPQAPLLGCGGCTFVVHNRFRKLPVRYEKLYRSYHALTMLAAAIICIREVNTKVNIIYG